MVVQSDEGVNYKRYITYFKKFVEKDSNESTNQDHQMGRDQLLMNSDGKVALHLDSESKSYDTFDQSQDLQKRPLRLKKKPLKFQDYAMNKDR